MRTDTWPVMSFTEAVVVNPPVHLEKGRVYPFVDMASVNPAARSVHESEHREFRGGGSRFMAGDTLMARITPCLENGKIARFRPTDGASAGFGSTEFIVIRGRDGLTDNDFAYYLTKWDEFRQFAVSQMAGTSGRQRVPAESLAHFPVAVPPIEVQRRIAAILGALDDKIELNRRMSRTLEAMARALFKSWFVDFDPVQAKMEGRWKRGQSLPGLPAELYHLFPDRLVPSELGEIPEGWEVASLPDLVEINPSRPLRKGEIAPHLDMANMPIRGHAPDAVVDRPFGSGMRFINGDTLVARITPCLENGKTAFVDFLEDGQVGWGSTEYIVLRPRPPLPEEFAYCLARSDAFRDFAIQSMTGTSGRQRVQADSLEHFRLPRVPASVAEAFGRAIKPFFARSSAAVRESRTLAALREALLPKLLSDKIDVSALEGLAEESAKAGEIT